VIKIMLVELKKFVFETIGHIPINLKNLIKRYIDFSYDYIYWRWLNGKTRLSHDEWGIVCPAGLGDTYFVCALAKEFLKYNGGGNVSLIVKNSHADIPQLFKNDIERIIVLDDQNLRSIQRFMQFKIGNIIIGHPSFWNNGSSLNQLGVKDVTLIDLYKEMFNLDPNSPLSKPVMITENFYTAKAKFDEMKLPYGSTVVLAPEANSISSLPLSFWSPLSERLKEQGLIVCTNVVGTSKCIPGTLPISFTLSEAIPIAEFAGWVISSRSGLCDLISSARCKLTVIYEKQTWFAGTVLSGASLRSMGLSDSAREYEIDLNDDFNISIEKIVRE
jgi:hypothetical protein